MLTWISEEAHVAWIPDDGGDIIYGQLDANLHGGEGKDFKDLEVEDMAIRIQSNRGFELSFPMQVAVDRVMSEQFCRYDWRTMKPVRIGGVG